MASRPAGRPRSFDRDDALRQAARLFWRHGYSGTSTRVLASAMGISSSSLYAAFGTKGDLFGEAVRQYALRYSAIYDRAIAEPSVVDVIDRLLRDSVIEFTRADDGHPGCLTTSAVMSDSSPTFDARSFAAELQRVDEDRLLDRLNAAPANEHPRGVQPKDLAGLTQVLWQGLSTRAELGTGRDELLSAVASAVGLVAADH